MNLCKINGCKNKIYVKNWCIKHYMRWYRHGDPNVIKKEQHGYRKHYLYDLWANIKTRCYNKNRLRYKDWGGRGITMCDEWKNSARAFIEWALDNGWKKGLEIDRINNDGNYCPENCRFVTHIKNIHNNRLLYRHNKSGYRGVYYHNRDKKWIAQISINNKKQYLGYFNAKKEAALAYNNAIPDNRPRNIL